MFQPAQRKNISVHAAIMGPSGSGKSTAALRLARGLAGPTGRIAAIDTERKSLSLYADITPFDVQELNPPFEPGRFIELVKQAKDYDVLIIDSFSHVWEAVLAIKDRMDRGGRGNSFTNWGAAGDIWREALEAVLNLPIHTVCCLRSKQAYVIEEEKGKQVPKKAGLAPIVREGTDYEFSVVFDLDMGHHAVASKDRSSLFGRLAGPITEHHGELLRSWAVEGVAVSHEQPAGELIEATIPEYAPVTKAMIDMAIQLSWISSAEEMGSLTEEHLTYLRQVTQA